MALIARTHDNEGESKPAGTPSRREGPSREDVTRWLRALIAPEGCVELRAVGVGRKGQGEHVEASFFTLEEADAMAVAALALSGRAKGIYSTLNPVHSSLYLDVNHASAKATDILSRRWILVDCDPIKPEADASTTDLEKSASALVAREIRKHLRSLGWPDPVLADSGNGHHLLYRIDLPNDDDAHELVKKVLKHLAATFGNREVSIDTAVHDAPRICKVYGTLARKGEPTADRPHRFSRVIDLPETVAVVPAESLRALVAEANGTTPELPTTPRKGLVAKAKVATDPQRAYALAALKAETDKVATCGSGGRNVQLNSSAFALGQLVAAGQLGEGEVVASLVVAAMACGLDVTEATRAITNGMTAGKALPRDLAEVGKGTANGHANGHGIGNGVPRGLDAPGAGGGAIEADDDPHRLAGVYLDSECSHEQGLTLRYWMERWHRWNGSAWRILPDAEVSAEVTRSIKREFDRIAELRGKTTKGVGTKTVGNVLQALRSRTLLTSRDCPRQPAWLSGVGPEPLECLVATNGVIHLPSFVTGNVEPIAPTPAFFSPNALEYPFDSGASAPVEWLQFLHTLWQKDPESIDCLQEWFGYLITPDTRQQKMLFVIGPRRSGKGTIFRVLGRLVGLSNVVSPTLSGLATHFGAAPLIGKSLAIVPDARLSARADAQVVVERLLSITGEDAQTIDRKHREDWTGDLLTRFAIASNELPRMGDASSALPGRVILLRLTRSFFGEEDQTLLDRLIPELPGILLWAIQGWERLRERGRFQQPKSGQKLLDELDAISSPISAFIAEKCITGSEEKIPTKELYAAWKKWCEDCGKQQPGDIQRFGSYLRTAMPELETRKIGGRNSQILHYIGLSLIGETGEY